MGSLALAGGGGEGGHTIGCLVGCAGMSVRAERPGLPAWAGAVLSLSQASLCTYLLNGSNVPGGKAAVGHRNGRGGVGHLLEKGLHVIRASALTLAAGRLVWPSSSEQSCLAR